MSARDAKIVIGIDEAGYGPKLGPLVVAGSAWLVPSDLAESQWVNRLSPAFSGDPWAPGALHVPLADSKRLYQRSQGLTTLEAGAVSMLAISGGTAGKIGRLVPRAIEWNQDHPQPFGEEVPPAGVLPDGWPPWYDLLWDAKIPGDGLDWDDLQGCIRRASDTLERHHMRLLGLHCVLVCEHAFNREVDRLASKGHVLSETSLRLAHRIMDGYRAGDRGYENCPVEVYFDRQGGRKNYAPLLMQEFPETWFSATEVQARRSRYRSRSRPWTFCFTVQGDAFPPVAAASVWAKYVRERAMEAFNAYWSPHLPDLAPTAGYPQDAARFDRAIAPVAERLGIERSRYWRTR